MKGVEFQILLKTIGIKTVCVQDGAQHVSIFVLLIVVAINNDGGDFFLNINEHLYINIYKEEKKRFGLRL